MKNIRLAQVWITRKVLIIKKKPSFSKWQFQWNLNNLYWNTVNMIRKIAFQYTLRNGRTLTHKWIAYFNFKEGKKIIFANVSFLNIFSYLILIVPIFNFTPTKKITSEVFVKGEVFKKKKNYSKTWLLHRVGSQWLCYEDAMIIWTLSMHCWSWDDAIYWPKLVFPQD